MTAYLGRPGSFDALTVSSPMPIEVAGQVRSVTTLGGRRVAQLPVARSRRVWTVSRNAALPQEWAVWQEYADGLWGVGPHTFIDPWTQVTNVLTREQSLGQGIDGLTPTTGRLTLPSGQVIPGWGTRSVGTTTVVDIPVVPGVPVTVTALLTGSGSPSVARLKFRSPSGLSTGVELNYTGTEQVVLTATPGAEVATAEIEMPYATVVAGFQVTFTPGPVDAWVVGQAAQVVVSGGSHAPIIATHDVALTAGSVTVTEVG